MTKYLRCQQEILSYLFIPAFNVIKRYLLNLDVKKLVFFEFVTFKRGEEFLFCRATVGDDGLQGVSGALNYWLECGEVQVVWKCLERSTTCAVYPLSCDSGLTASSRHLALSASRVSECS